jgi:hypothetical protein
MTRRAGLEAWLKANAWAIICTICGGVAAIYSGYLTGQTTTTARLTALEQTVAQQRREIDSITRSQDARRGFMGCAVRNLDQINQRLGVEPPCVLEITE